MSRGKNYIGKLQSRLAGRANHKTKNWWEKYLKHVIAFRGVKMADIRTELHGWYEDEAIATALSAAKQKALALNLLRECYSEDKMAGILFLQEILLPSNSISWKKDLPHFANLFLRGYVYDWNICDWFCVKVLGPMAAKEGEACARAIADWKTSKNLWQRRASGVAFVYLAAKGDENFPGFTDMLLEVCAETVSCSERFAQTGTGWVLRELSICEQDRVLGFIKAHINHFSSEGLRYAMEKIPKSEVIKLKKLYRERMRVGRSL